MTIAIYNSNICSAFALNAIGTRVVRGGAFLNALTDALGVHDTSTDRVSGQHFVQLPASAYDSVSAGVGKRSQDTNDYVVRTHRDQVNLYLKREKAATVEGLNAIVYTREAYLNDPDVRQDSYEMGRVGNSDATHILVAVLASAGPKSPLTPDRFVKNLAGGNRETLMWGVDEIRAKAREIADYYSEWCVVAD